jgi:hypothetical protein
VSEVRVPLQPEINSSFLMRRTPWVRGGVAPEALVDASERKRHGQKPDREVDPEDPIPRELVATTPPTTGPPVVARPVMHSTIPIAVPRRSGRTPR